MLKDIKYNKNKSCRNCIHWKKIDVDFVLWEVQPPEPEECEIEGVERSWKNIQDILDIGLREGKEAKLGMIARNCPSLIH